jgi:hypothetical protein
MKAGIGGHDSIGLTRIALTAGLSSIRCGAGTADMSVSPPIFRVLLEFWRLLKVVSCSLLYSLAEIFLIVGLGPDLFALPEKWLLVPLSSMTREFR